MSKRQSTRKNTKHRVDTSGAGAGDTSAFVTEFPCKVCHEPVNFYTETKSRSRKPTTYKQHCEPHLECIRKLLCERNCNITELCNAFKFNRTTFYKWLERYSELREIVEEGREVKVEKLERCLADFATDYNPKARAAAVRACEIILKAESPEKYAERLKAEHSGDVDYNVSMNSIIERQREYIRKKKAEAGE